MNFTAATIELLLGLFFIGSDIPALIPREVDGKRVGPEVGIILQFIFGIILVALAFAQGLRMLQ